MKLRLQLGEQVGVYYVSTAIAPKGLQLLHSMPLRAEGGGRGEIIPLFPDLLVFLPIRTLRHVYGPKFYGTYLTFPVPGVTWLNGDRGVILTLLPELPFLPHLSIRRVG